MRLAVTGFCCCVVTARKKTNVKLSTDEVQMRLYETMTMFEFQVPLKDKDILFIEVDSEMFCKKG